VQEAASNILKIVVDKGAHWMSSLVACLIFIHGMRPQRISAFADKYISSILLLSVTPQSEIGNKEKKKGGNLLIFSRLYLGN